MVLATAVEFDYLVSARGTSIDNTALLMSAVPIPLDGMSVYGAQLFEDTIIKGSDVNRRIKFQFAPDTDATVAGVTFDESGGITAVDLATNGGPYGAPPIVTVIEEPAPGAQRAQFLATLITKSVFVVNGGTAYVAPTIQFVGGLAPPQIDPTTGMYPESCLQLLTISSPGKGYSANAALRFLGTLAQDGRYPAATPTFDSGGHLIDVQITDAGQGILSPLQCFVWDPGPTGGGVGGGTGATVSCSLGVGVPATGTVNIGAGVITSITLVTIGGPYVMPPQVVVTDAAGSGAVLIAQMGVGAINVVNPGQGYPSVVTFSIEPLIRAQSNGSPMANLFKNMMTAAIQRAVMAPTTENGPFIT